MSVKCFLNEKKEAKKLAKHSCKGQKEVTSEKKRYLSNQKLKTQKMRIFHY